MIWGQRYRVIGKGRAYWQMNKIKEGTEPLDCDGQIVEKIKNVRKDRNEMETRKIETQSDRQKVMERDERDRVCERGGVRMYEGQRGRRVRRRKGERKRE